MCKFSNPTLRLSLLLSLVLPFSEHVAMGGSNGKGVSRISKISFLIHPVCWDLALGKEGKLSPAYLAGEAKSQGKTPQQVEQEFMQLLEWERRVNHKQKEYIDKMGSDEVLVIYPIGDRPAMKELEQYGQQRLGRHCIIIRSESPQGNKKVDYRKLLPESARLEVADDLIEAIQGNGRDPKFDMEVIFYNRMVALEIQEQFRNRGLRFDPKTVETVAFGEGFAGCAMTWKAMLPQYLGLTKPIENDFDLSVDGPVQLSTANFKERVTVADNVRLFLWELKDGRLMALFTRPQGRFADRQLYVTLPFHPNKLTVLEGGKELPLKTDRAGAAKVPVYTALRRTSDSLAYLVARDISFEQFRQALQGATIGPEY